MIVSTSLIRRRDDVSPEEFKSHWLHPHGTMTAKLPGTQRYIQNHVVDGPGTNALAKKLRIDGFPQLAFDSPESRVAAHNSPELKACDLDSPLFIGAVGRVISDDGDAQPYESDATSVKQIVLSVRTGKEGEQSASRERLALTQLEGVQAIISHQVIQQGAAPNSVVPFIGVEVDALYEVWTKDVNSVVRNTARLEREAPELATFSVEVHKFI
jgi:uncharacterized protein (TIGR02118 family)